MKIRICKEIQNKIFGRKEQKEGKAKKKRWEKKYDKNNETKRNPLLKEPSNWTEWKLDLNSEWVYDKLCLQGEILWKALKSYFPGLAENVGKTSLHRGSKARGNQNC